ncbi:MAG: polymer-forming cytoskeletal protein [Spirochaetes bacterium]|nr:polymer-forming cytoskeletal protein [Spirochaetota bacterium]MBN2772356.1 polymer-forming cytoskeletal protein [Spirochaetota bacterium]HRX14731.1 polymer-forming cytoskeletal protein [Spirochaetota bacterium]
MAPRIDSLNSTIGDGSVFEGKFYINGSLKIDGKFEGEIKTDEELVVGETGKVRTNIEAKSVTVAGTVIGNIKALNEVRLLETAKVLGDIEAPNVSVQKGVVLTGRINICGEYKKDLEKVVEDSYNSTPLEKYKKQ